jgi:LysM repeat protein
VERVRSLWPAVVCVVWLLALGGCTRERALDTPTATMQPDAVLETPSPAPSPQPTPTQEIVVYHTVQAGETMWDIASQYGVTLEALTAANESVDPDHLQPGQELVIPQEDDDGAASSAPATIEAPAGGQSEPVSGRTHTVGPGDTLWDIAAEYGTTVQEIAELNDLDPEGVLTVGQQLLLP